MKIRNLIGRPTARAMAMIAGAGLISAAGVPALAQTSGFDSGDPAVTVDLSVLEGGSSASGAMSAPSAGAFTGRLRMPNADTPVSRLHVKPRSEAAAPPSRSSERLAATAAKGPVMPPAKSPESALRVPPVVRPTAPQAAAPAQPRPAPVIPAPSKSETLASAPPRPAVEKPQDLTAAPKPPAVEKPQVAVATPKPPATSAAPPPPAIEKPQVAVAAPKPQAAPVAPPPPAAVEKPQVTAPQAPAIAVPAPPPPPAADAGQVAAATPAPPAVEQAALPKTTGKATPGGDALKVIFDTEEAKLSEQSRAELKSMVQGILDKADLRVQLLAYAGGEALSSSKARRLSLSRALAVRSYLIENGLRSTRIDVRALGDKTTEEPVNRVDVNIVER